MAMTEKELKKTLEQLSVQCTAQGGHLTRLRQFLLGLLLEAGKPVKAYDLIEESANRGRRLTPTTVYRVLDYLIERGLVHKVNAINAFVACSASESQGHHQPLILVCPDCQKTSEINDPDLAVLLFGRLSDLGYRLKGGSIEVHGKCQVCSGK